MLYKKFKIVSLENIHGFWFCFLLSGMFMKLVNDDPIEKQIAQEKLVLYLTVSTNLTIPQTNRQPNYHL